MEPEELFLSFFGSVLSPGLGLGIGRVILVILRIGFVAGLGLRISRVVFVVLRIGFVARLGLRIGRVILVVFRIGFVAGLGLGFGRIVFVVLGVGLVARLGILVRLFRLRLVGLLLFLRAGLRVALLAGVLRVLLLLIVLLLGAALIGLLLLVLLLFGVGLGGDQAHLVNARGADVRLRHGAVIRGFEPVFDDRTFFQIRRRAVLQFQLVDADGVLVFDGRGPGVVFFAAEALAVAIRFGLEDRAVFDFQFEGHAVDAEIVGGVAVGGQQAIERQFVHLDLGRLELHDRCGVGQNTEQEWRRIGVGFTDSRCEKEPIRAVLHEREIDFERIAGDFTDDRLRHVLHDHAAVLQVAIGGGGDGDFGAAKGFDVRVAAGFVFEIQVGRVFVMDRKVCENRSRAAR